MQKIAILIERLNGGGAERSAAQLSILISKLKYEVSIITLYDDVEFLFEGELINLGKHEKVRQSFFRKIKRYLRLRDVLKENSFDLVLDFRLKDSVLREVLLNVFVFKNKMVNMVRSFKIEWYLPKPKFISKLLYQNYSSINTVSNQIKERIKYEYNFTNVSAIYSPVDINFISNKSKDTLNINDDFVISIGRLDANKQFDKLIDAYSKSILPQNDIFLYIMGKSPEHGSIKEKLEKKIENLNLKNKIKLIAFQKNPFPYIRKSRFLILSSINEGLPRVLLESLACRTPVVSLNCKSGPSEIILNRINGLLVENQNFDKLTLALNEMQTNLKLYNHCKKNSELTLKKFSNESISVEWKNLLKKLI